MRSKTWLITAVLLGLTLAAGNGSHSADEEQPYDPVAEARREVDEFLRLYRPDLDDSILREWTCAIYEGCAALRIAGDLRIVKPFVEILADTTHTDIVSYNIIATLCALRARSAAPVIKLYLNSHSKPYSRLQAAITLAILGEAEIAIPVLEELAPQWSSSITWAFVDFGWRAIQLDNPVQESLVVSYFQRIGEKAMGQELVYVVCYLLQKDEKSRDIAFRRAEDVLKTRAASADTSTVHSIRVLLERFGGERGKALLSKYQ